MKWLAVLFSWVWVAPVWAAGSCYQMATTSYNFEDISSTGTGALSGQDNASTSAVLGFNFRLYDTTSNTIFWSTNGLVTMSSGNTSGANVDFLTTAIPQKAIAVLWDDWTFNAPGADQTYYQQLGSAPNRYFIIQWNNACADAACTGGSVTFEVKLFETSNTIEIDWKDTTTQTANSQGASSTVGIRDSGSQLSCTTNPNPLGCFDAPLLCPTSGVPTGCNRVKEWSSCPVISGGTGGCATISDQTAIQFTIVDCTLVTCTPNTTIYSKNFNDNSLSGYTVTDTIPAGNPKLWHLTTNFPYTGNTNVLGYTQNETAGSGTPDGDYDIGGVAGDIQGPSFSITAGDISTMTIRYFIGDEFDVQPNNFDALLVFAGLNNTQPARFTQSPASAVIVASSLPGQNNGDVPQVQEGIRLTEWGGVAAYQLTSTIDLSNFAGRTITPIYRFDPMDGGFNVYPGVRFQTIQIDTCTPVSDTGDWGWAHRP